MQLSRQADAAPLYRQIEDRLEYEILTGRRPAGARLPSLRDAAAAWGVNLHTVRKAYKALESSGLARIGARGARVALLEPAWQTAVREFAERMRAEHGLSAQDLVGILEGIGAPDGEPPPGVCLVECSRTLSRELADAVSDRLGLEVESIDLHDDRSLPPGPVIGTYFHAAHLRHRLQGRSEDLHLVRIRPAEALFKTLLREARAGRCRRVIIMDRLPGSAADLAADFESRLGDHATVETRILSDPRLAFPAAAPHTRVVASPQTWDRLVEPLRARSDVVRLSYEIEPSDLAALPRAIGATSLNHRGG